ncbi:MAG: hypothetical protein ACJ790_03870 [Myxococcaceae bacterium]
MRVFIGAVTLLLLAGCGPKYGMKVPGSMLDKLPYESRIELLEAENDLAVAIDHRDEAENEVLRTRDALRRAKDRLSAAEDEASDADDKVAKEVAELAVQEANARVDFLRAQQVVNVKKLDIEDISLRCAHARFEMARLGLARKAKVEGSESLDPKAFEEQAKSCDSEVGEMKTALKEQTTAAEQARDSWDKQKAALAKKTFDARASPYVE